MGYKDDIGTHDQFGTSVDRWAHRSTGMRCFTCLFFVPKKIDPTIGRCRRHAPTMSGFPVVWKEDWCGDHKLNEAVALGNG